MIAAALEFASMGLPQVLAALALCLPVLALYLWFRRRQRAQVSYLRIWERVAKQQQRSWWRWVRWLLSLLLALAILVALVLAAARPDAPPDRPPPGAPISHHVAVLIDPSVSVATRGWSSDAARTWLREQLTGLAAARLALRGDTLDVIVETPSGVQIEPQRDADRALPGAPDAAWLGDDAAHGGIHAAADWASMVQLATDRLAARTANAGQTGTIPLTHLLVISDGQPPAAPWTVEGNQWTWPAAAAPATARTFTRVQPDAGPARASFNVAIVGLQLSPPAPAAAESIDLTVEYTTSDAAALPTVDCEVTTKPALDKVRITLHAGTPAVVRVPLPTGTPVPSGAVRGASGPHTWRLDLTVQPVDAALAARDARPADHTTSVVLPVFEPVPLVVVGTGVSNPLVIPLVQLLQERGICKLVRSRDVAPGDPLPVLLQLDDLPGNIAIPPHAARIHFGTDVRAPGDLVQPGNLLDWPQGHGLFRVDDLASVPLAVREARVFAPLDPLHPERTVPIIVGPHGVVADYTPAAPGDAQPPIPLVRVGFSLAPGNTDFLLQPGLAPLLFKRLLRLVAPRVSPPVPALVQLGDPLLIDFSPGSALSAAAMPRGTVEARVPGARTLPLSLPLPAPPLTLQAGVPLEPGTATVRVVGGATWRVAVQRMDARESAVPAAPAAATPGAAVATFVPTDVYPLDNDAPPPDDPATDLWPTLIAWLLLAVLGLMVIESVLYRLRLAE